ncbi:MAG: NAD-dependent malic enzyme, partial [Clostridiales bacterium]|nr:NAD-dependent malic enzyme [Clostridiales bacterium]
KGSLADALAGADVFIGVSSANLVSADMIKGMNSDPIVFALANPVPEINPDLAKEAGARIVGTGRSDYPNQINNVLAFPGVFRGALDVRATDINEEMRLAAAYAIAGVVAEEDLNDDYIIPKPFDPRVAPAVARAVAKAAMDSGVARVKVDPEKIAQRTKEMLEKTFS